MKLRLIYLIFFVLTVDHCVRSHKYIGDCEYKNEYGIYRLTFICVENYVTTNVFSDDWSYCKTYVDQENELWISFKNCKFSQIPNNIFKVYYNTHSISLSFLDLETLQPENFVGAEKLSILSVNHNKFTKIPANVFHEAVNLFLLDISNNEIDYFDPNAFSTANIVENIDLSNNNISAMPVETFEKLVKLEKLNLSHNKITTLSPLLFKKMSRLTHLYVAFNRINILNVDTTATLPKLAYFSISGNLIKTISNKTFQFNDDLETLELSNCGLLEIQTGTFSTLKKLKNLDLSQNELKTLDLNTLPPNYHQLKIKGIDSNKFNCSYINELVQLFRPQHLGAVSHRINCSAVPTKNAELPSIESTTNHNGKTSNTRPLKIETFFEEATQKPVQRNEIETTPKFKKIFTSTTEKVATFRDVILDFETTTKTQPNVGKIDSNRVPTKKENSLHDHLAAVHTKLDSIEKRFSNNVDLNSMSNYLFAIISLVATGFTFIVFAVVWKMINLQFSGTISANQVIYRRDEHFLPNAVENHSYEVIKFNK